MQSTCVCGCASCLVKLLGKVSESLGKMCCARPSMDRFTFIGETHTHTHTHTHQPFSPTETHIPPHTHTHTYTNYIYELTPTNTIAHPQTSTNINKYQC